MRALVQEGSGSADVLHLREVEPPVVTEASVLIRVRAASVNAADWHLIHGGAAVRAATFLMRSQAAQIRGSDLAGVVEAVGAGVTELKPGDEVFGTARGAFAELAATTSERLVLKPAGASFEQAAAIPVAGCTALQGLRDAGRLKSGERVLVYGAGGGVGTFAVQVAAALGATVTAVTHTRSVELVRSLFQGEVIDYTKEDALARDARYDVVCDVAGTRPLGDLLRVLAPGGRLVVAGAAKGGTLDMVGRIGGVMILGRLGAPVRLVMAKITHQDLQALGAMVDAGKLRPAIDRTFRFEDAVEAVRYVGTGQARAKVVITL